MLVLNHNFNFNYIINKIKIVNMVLKVVKTKMSLTLYSLVRVKSALVAFFFFPDNITNN